MNNCGKHSTKKRKTCIGGYDSERDAAIAFDFYCMVFHSLRTKTNFNYSKETFFIWLKTSWKQKLLQTRTVRHRIVNIP